MDPPQPRYMVEDVVLGVTSEVRHDDCQDERERRRSRDLVEQTPTALAT
jgi:hypothetical protein